MNNNLTAYEALQSTPLVRHWSSRLWKSYHEDKDTMVRAIVDGSGFWESEAEEYHEQAELYIKYFPDWAR